jgi:hypothetical protein
VAIIIIIERSTLNLDQSHSTATAQYHSPVTMSISLLNASSFDPTVKEEDDDIIVEAEMSCQFIHNSDHNNNNNNNNDYSTMPIPETTATTTTTTNNNNVNENAAEETFPVTHTENKNYDDEIQIGDHVYQWRHLLGIPCVFQHHGIVMDVIRDHQGKTIKLTIADFSNVETNNKCNRQQKRNKKQKPKQNDKETTVIIHNNQPTDSESTTTISSPLDCHTKQEGENINLLPTLDHNNNNTNNNNTSSNNDKNNNNSKEPSVSTSTTNPKRRLSLAQKGIVRAYTDTNKWYRVHYQAPWWKRQVYRSGTATKAKSDPLGMVLARVNFIIHHPHLLPDYHVLHANCECVAFWCKTGRWSTLQASRFLELTTAGQVKSSATLAAAAAGATTTVTVPASGVWGWLGYTSTAQVSWMSLHPLAMPGLACYAVVTIAIPAMMYASAQRQWTTTTNFLTNAFWEWATEQPEIFAELITYWSDKDA